MLLSDSFSLWKRTRALKWVWRMCPTHHTHHCWSPSPVLIANDQPLRFLGEEEVTGSYMDVLLPTTKVPKEKMGQWFCHQGFQLQERCPALQARETEGASDAFYNVLKLARRQKTRKTKQQL